MHETARAVLLVFFIVSIGAGCAASERTSSPADEREEPGTDAAPERPVLPSKMAGRYPLIPWPKELEEREGRFVVNAKTRIMLSEPSNPEARAVADGLATLIRNATVFPMRVSETPATGVSAAEQPENTISFVLSGDKKAPAGRYRLEVTPRAVVVRAAAPKGLFYGMQTLRQLLPPALEEGLGYDDGQVDWTMPAVRVEDAPRFPYRGMHLDVVRHFMPVSFVKKYIDLLATYKLDTFHWHLTDSQGWRIEIKQYPRLTSVGACRDSSMVNHPREGRFYDGAEYCGYYTQEEIKEVVRYAQERHVTIIPEIEMPGHSNAALAAYPKLGCTGGPYAVKATWGIFEDIFCPKEETFAFLKNVLTEVMALFPSEYIHIGGDEVVKKQWKESKVAQEVMRRENLEDEEELQSYFIRRIEQFLHAQGRRLIGWDEILQGGLPPRATVMSWRGIEGGVQAARRGHDAVMTPGNHLYFDHYQGPPEEEPLAIGGLTTLQDVYAYDPVPDSLSAEAARHIIGAQANVWTEFINTPNKVEYMAYPRALALAEIAWSPETARDWAHFRHRLRVHLRRLDALGVHYRRPDMRAIK